MSEEITQIIEEDKSISTLVLAAGADPAGPGPLVSLVASGRSSIHIPVTIVPGNLSDDEIDMLT
jgi:hypothetical protein